MKTWIFSERVIEFKNLNLCLIKNNKIDLSFNKEINYESLNVGDEVFIWGSIDKVHSNLRILARSKVTSILKNKNTTVRIKIIETDLENKFEIRNINEKKHLYNLISSKLKNKLIYLLPEDDGSYLRSFWYAHCFISKEEVVTRFSLVDSIEEIKNNMKRFDADLQKYDKLRKGLSRFQQWYYIHEDNLIAPSKFIGYKDMNGILYVDKDAIAWTDGRDTKHCLSKWFVPYRNEGLENYIREYFGKPLRKPFKINVLESELNIIEKEFSEAVESIKLPTVENEELSEVIDLDIEAEKAEEGYGIEGKSRDYYGKRYERNARNRMVAIQEHGLSCKACKFNFETVYGERGKDFIEVHHVQPLGTIKRAVKINPKTDLIPLCSNCHRMIHRRKDKVLTLSELIMILKQKKNEL